MANVIVEEIAPQPGEVVIRKTGPSIFPGTPLAFHLNALGIDTLTLYASEERARFVRFRQQFYHRLKSRLS